MTAYQSIAKPHQPPRQELVGLLDALRPRRANASLPQLFPDDRSKLARDPV